MRFSQKEYEYKNGEYKQVFFTDEELISIRKRTKSLTIPMKRVERHWEMVKDLSVYKTLIAPHNNVLVFDLEIYPNYFLAAFKNFYTGEVFYFEMSEYANFNIQDLLWVMH